MAARHLALLVLGATLALTVGCADEQPNRAVVEEGPLPADLVTTTAPTTLPIDDIGPPTIDESTTVSTVGIGPLTFGLTQVDAELAAGTYFTRSGADQPEECFEVTPTNGPEGLSLTVEDGTVERLDVTATGVTTRSGAGVGSSLDELQDLFGDRLRVAENDDGSTAATFVPTDPEDANYRIIFDVEDGSVVRYRSGSLPLVRDGC